MIDQTQANWLADQIALSQYRQYGCVLPDVDEIVSMLQEGYFTKKENK